MSELERYHGNEDDIIPQRKTQNQKVYKNTVHENLPDPETENEKPGVDFEDWDEENENKNADTDLEEFDHVGDPNDDHLLAIEREELMKKYDNVIDTNNTEDHSEPVFDLDNESIEPKHESISTATKRRVGKYGSGYGLKVNNQALGTERLLRKTSKAPMLGRDNLKTMPDEKKQRTFRERIRNFLNFN